MLRHRLIPHPQTPNPTVTGVVVTLDLCPDADLELHYHLTAPAGTLRLPPAARPGPADNLWQHTCCELFVAAPHSTAYREFNFSPSGQWAVYDFAAYRQAAPPPALPGAPSIALTTTPDGVSLTARIPHALLPSGCEAHIGLSTVVETTDGTLSYWALRHAGERPDFHQRNIFTASLDRPLP